jgi:hypothetical protein
MNYDFDAHPVSYVTGDAPGLLIAVEPYLVEQPGEPDVIRWRDPLNSRAFQLAKVTTDQKAKLVFSDRLGRKITLVPMTLKIYMDKVAPKLGRAWVFRTQDQMVGWFTEGVLKDDYVWRDSEDDEDNEI